MKPNIIFFMTDQQRWDALGCVNSLVKTPNLDRLARNGILFRQAVCQTPQCVPSRYSMMLGKYSSQIGVLTNGDTIIDDADLPGVPLPELFRLAGYQTAGFGKTHWNNGLSARYPSRRGFDVRAIGQPRDSELYEEGALMMGEVAPDHLAAYFQETDAFGPGEEEAPGYIGCTSSIPPGWHRDGWVAEQCLDFIENGIDPERPLFLYLSFLKPHAGFNVPEKFEQLYRLEDIPDVETPPWDEESGTHLSCGNTPWLDARYQRWRASWGLMDLQERRRATLRYWANCSWLDDYFGQVFRALEKQGVLENALIVFTSDHGDMMGERNHRFSKYCLYDGSVRVPLIISGNAVVPELHGMVSDRPAELIDLVPTLCDTAGIPTDLPGENLFEAPVREGTFCEYHGGGMDEENPAPSYMWRTSKWKLILFRDGTQTNPGPLRGELYDLQDDPLEWNNLYDIPRYCSVQAELTSCLQQHINELSLAFGARDF